MASPLGHSMMGIVIYLASVRSSDWLKRWGWLFLLILFSAAADLDYLPAAFGRLDLADRFHRKFTHTILFAVSGVTLYLTLTWILTRRIIWKSAAVLLTAMLVHLIIDVTAFDEKEPKGIAPFEPFASLYVYGPLVIFPPIKKGSYADIISIHNIKVALYEIAFFGSLIAITIGLSLLIERKRKVKDEG